MRTKHSLITRLSKARHGGEPEPQPADLNKSEQPTDAEPLLKAKSNVGEIHHWTSGTYQKQQSGHWKMTKPASWSRPTQAGGGNVLSGLHLQTLVDTAHGKHDLNQLAKEALAHRGHDSRGLWVGFDAAKKHHGIDKFTPGVTNPGSKHSYKSDSEDPAAHIQGLSSATLASAASGMHDLNHEAVHELTGRGFDRNGEWANHKPGKAHAANYAPDKIEVSNPMKPSDSDYSVSLDGEQHRVTGHKVEGGEPMLQVENKAGESQWRHASDFNRKKSK